MRHFAILRIIRVSIFSYILPVRMCPSIGLPSAISKKFVTFLNRSRFLPRLFPIQLSMQERIKGANYTKHAIYHKS